ncbi:MAG: hypothetical protein PHC28_08030 [Flavobacterium sp.]|uniref:hypothetical protein n=1 Tax=Flavobacterium sp. TaxID=239 RepID=UPI0026351BC7|nr:hypothetical protein [Flavobacterium sp.]MDD5150419.1 hypothetical protein [Flavobacterium sp.]
MNITEVYENVIYTVRTDDSDLNEYHRYGADNWWVTIGEDRREEMVIDPSELEQKFQHFLDYKICGSSNDDTLIDICAKAIFNCSDHKMLKAAGFSTEWEKQPLSLKIDYIKKAKAVLGILK